MKVSLRPAAAVGLRQRLLRWSGKPWAESLLRGLAAMTVGFLLAGVQVREGFLPLSTALAAAFGLEISSFGAYIGGCIGYAAFFGLDIAVEPMAAGLLVEATLCIFGDQVSEENRWFAPGCTMLFTAAVGFLFLLQSRFPARLVWLYLLRIAAAGLGTLCFRAAMEPAGQKVRIVVLALLCSGLCAVQPFGFPLGLIAGCAVAAAAAPTPAALLAAAFCGMALEVSWGSGCTAALILATIGSGWLSHTLLRQRLWVVLLAVTVAVLDTPLLLVAAAVPGALLAPLLPTGLLFGQPSRRLTTADPRLALASHLLEQVSSCLAVTRQDQPDPETNAVFDQAAERVCRLCSRWDICWEAELSQTCDVLNRAAPAMMTRGMALREDLLPDFAEQCRHLEGFLTAINRELEDLSCRRQYRRRLRESRLVLAQQFRVLSAALAQRRPESPGAFRFQPELGFRSQGRRQQSLSGDRGVSFRVGQQFYLLLCDGMGTGQAASAEAGAAIEILRALLQSGVEPKDALKLLNGIYILRDDGGFATVDLLQADLVTGEASLYKWGGAPSYLKRKGHVEKIGTASPPPGLGAGEEHHPEEAKLSLARGELLVLVTDGAGGEAAERFIRQYGGGSPKELASGVVNCSSTQGEDDRTAAVLALRPRLSM